MKLSPSYGFSRWLERLAGLLGGGRQECAFCGRKLGPAPVLQAICEGETSEKSRSRKKTKTSGGRCSPVPLLARIADRNLLCPLCLAELQVIGEPLCFRCGRPWAQGAFPASDGDQHPLLCHDCLRRRHTYLICNRSCLAYNDKMKEIMALYKYRGKETLARVLGEMLHEAYCLYYRDVDFAAVTFVPLHAERERERGFNQAERLARVLAERAKLPLLALLKRTRPTAKQSKRGKEERIVALRGAFRVLARDEAMQWLEKSASSGHRKKQERALERWFAGKAKILLIDDIYTTGTTAQECAKVLREAGARGVYALTVCR